MNNKINFIDEPCPELLCGICSGILDEPIQVHCPEDHMFCSKCINLHIENKSNCPLCLTVLDKSSFQTSKFVQRQISRLRIRCSYLDSGCSWSGLLSDNHIQDCQYKPCVCPNVEKGCNDKTINSLNIQDHLKTCLYQTLNCPNNMPLCQPFLLKDLSIHENQCQSYTCPYGSEGCSFIGTLSQVNIHCENYCGRLHQKITDLENQVKKLNTLMQDITMGLNVKLPSTPENNLQETDKQQDNQQHDVFMNQIDLLQHIFNNDSLNMNLSSSVTTNLNSQTLISNTSPSSTSIPTISNLTVTPMEDISTIENNDTTTMMDLANCLTNTNFVENNNNNDSNYNKERNSIVDHPILTQDFLNFDSLFEPATSPTPLQFVPPLNTPKRTSNGKIIRYSKNKRLARSALRIARQRIANDNPTNDAILNNLDIAKQKKNKFKTTISSTSDSTKPLKTSTSSPTSITLSSSSPSSSSISINNKSNTIRKEKKKITMSSSPIETTSSPNSSSTPKRRPMFILASSYLSNYNNSNDKV